MPWVVNPPDHCIWVLGTHTITLFCHCCSSGTKFALFHFWILKLSFPLNGYWKNWNIIESGQLGDERAQLWNFNKLSLLLSIFLFLWINTVVLQWFIVIIQWGWMFYIIFSYDFYYFWSRNYPFPILNIL